jgi:hypothetical protein
MGAALTSVDHGGAVRVLFDSPGEEVGADALEDRRRALSVTDSGEWLWNSEAFREMKEGGTGQNAAMDWKYMGEKELVESLKELEAGISKKAKEVVERAKQHGKFIPWGLEDKLVDEWSKLSEIRLSSMVKRTGGTHKVITDTGLRCSITLLRKTIPALDLLTTYEMGDCFSALWKTRELRRLIEITAAQIVANKALQIVYDMEKGTGMERQVVLCNLLRAWNVVYLLEMEVDLENPRHTVAYHERLLSGENLKKVHRWMKAMKLTEDEINACDRLARECLICARENEVDSKKHRIWKELSRYTQEDRRYTGGERRVQRARAAVEDYENSIGLRKEGLSEDEIAWLNQADNRGPPMMGRSVLEETLNEARALARYFVGKRSEASAIPVTPHTTLDSLAVLAGVCIGGYEHPDLVGEQTAARWIAQSKPGDEVGLTIINYVLQLSGIEEDDPRRNIEWARLVAGASWRTPRAGSAVGVGAFPVVRVSSVIPGIIHTRINALDSMRRVAAGEALRNVGSEETMMEVLAIVADTPTENQTCVALKRMLMKKAPPEGNGKEIEEILRSGDGVITNILKCNTLSELHEALLEVEFKSEAEVRQAMVKEDSIVWEVMKILDEGDYSDREVGAAVGKVRGWFGGSELLKLPKREQGLPSWLEYADMILQRYVAASGEGWNSELTTDILTKEQDRDDNRINLFMLIDEIKGNVAGRMDPAERAARRYSARGRASGSGKITSEMDRANLLVAWTIGKKQPQVAEILPWLCGTENEVYKQILMNVVEETRKREVKNDRGRSMTNERDLQEKESRYNSRMRMERGRLKTTMVRLINEGCNSAEKMRASIEDEIKEITEGLTGVIAGGIQWESEKSWVLKFIRGKIGGL